MITIQIDKDKIAENVAGIALQKPIQKGGSYNIQRDIADCVERAVEQVCQDWNVPKDAIDTIVIHKMVDLKWRRLNA